jgi:hypothetical protein
MERGAWTDQKLDDFRERVELRFDALDRQTHDGFARVDQELIEMRAEVAAIRNTMVQFGGRLMVALGGVIVGLLGVIAAVLASG